VVRGRVPCVELRLRRAPSSQAQPDRGHSTDSDAERHGASGGRGETVQAKTFEGYFKLRYSKRITVGTEVLNKVLLLFCMTLACLLAVTAPRGRAGNHPWIQISPNRRDLPPTALGLNHTFSQQIPYHHRPRKRWEERSAGLEPLYR
jgi:hypothetical protein